MLAPGGVPREGEAHNVASSIDVCAGWAGRRVGAAWAARSGVPAEKMLGGKKRGGRGRHGGGGGRSGEDLKRSAWAPMYGGAGLSSSSSSSSTSSNGHGRRQVLGGSESEWSAGVGGGRQAGRRSRQGRADNARGVSRGAAALNPTAGAQAQRHGRILPARAPATHCTLPPHRESLQYFISADRPHHPDGAMVWLSS